MAEGPFFVDANVPMYAVGTDHPLKAPSVAILRAIAAGTIVAVTDSEVHQEILHRYTALGDRRRAVEVSRLFLEAVPDVLPVARVDVELATELLARHTALPVRDALHAAVMSRASVPRVITADRHFDAIAGIVRIDVAGWSSP